jgi:hypothetical protein
MRLAPLVLLTALSCTYPIVNPEIPVFTKECKSTYSSIDRMKTGKRKDIRDCAYSLDGKAYLIEREYLDDNGRTINIFSDYLDLPKKQADQ